jgi:hypothetical protein
MHVDPLITMLAAGVYLANFASADSIELSRSFEPAELPVFMVFFALAGAELDLDQLSVAWIPVTAIAATRAAIFFVGCRAACARTHAEDVITNHVWTGLVPQAGLALAFAVTIQRDFPTFGRAAALLILSVIGINQLVAPLLLRMSLIRSREVGRRTAQILAGP